VTLSPGAVRAGSSTMHQYFKIIGTGGYLPSRRVTAEDLDARLGLEPGWTRRHTGVLVRHQRAADENAAIMAVHAARMALTAAECSVHDLDLIIDASACQQQPIPCNAVLIQEELGPEAAGIASFDVHATCLSFVVALATVNGLFASGQHRRALIVSAETALDGVNWNDPASACLMGDGAAAVVVESVEKPVALLHYGYETFARYAHVCEVRAGGHRVPPDTWTRERDPLFRFAMDGSRLHKVASRHLPLLVQRVLADSGLKLEELHVVPHQASGPAVELLVRRLGIPRHRLHSSLAEHGNLVAAGIPYVLHRADAAIPRGECVMLLGTAAGYAQAAMILTW
jgi:3-oxoacyl-[acyl-carrier-protein] synthase III